MIKNYIVNAIFVALFSFSNFISQASPFVEMINLKSEIETYDISISCPPNQTETVTPTCIFTIPDYTGLATVTDPSAPPTITQSPVAGTIVGLGTYNITLTANDGTNISNCTFDIEVIDTTSPTLTCPIDQVEIFDENCQFVLPDYTQLASASDSCSPGDIPITQNPPPGTVISGTTTIFLFATDAVGNTGACTFDVIASDITPPTIICPADREESANINCLFVIPDYSPSATANDNCGIPTMTQIPVPGTIVGLGVTAITIIASDGISSTPCTFNITVIDDRPPIVNCPSDQTEDFDANCQFVLPDYSGLATVTDACYAGPFTMSQVPPAGTVITGDTTITIFAEDNAGNIGSCTFMVLQNDVTPPTIICPGNQIEEVNVNNCMFSLPDYTGLATAADNCNTVTVSQNPTPGSLVGVGTSTITLTANDGTNNTSCTFDILVEDTSMPNAVCAPPFNVSLDATGIATITANDVDGGSTDFCGILSMSIDVTSFTCDNLGPNTVTLTIEDTNGYISTCATTVTVQDPLFVCNQPPTAVCQPVVVDANANCEGEAVVSDFDAGSFDPEGLPTTITITPIGPYPLGVTNVTLTIDDGAFSDSCTTTITVLDTTPPILSCLENQYEAVDVNCSFIVPDYIGAITVSDNCSTISVTQNPAAGTVVSLGITSVEIIASDGPNQVTCSFNLTVTDETAPTAVCQNITVQLDANGMATITPEAIDGGSSDNCGNISIAIANDTFTCNDIGENIVVFTVTDDAGLTNTCSALVTVEDTIAPQVFCQNMTVVLDANNVAQIVATDIDAGSFDNCGIDSYVLDITNFDCSMVGENVVILSVTDVSGNVASCSAIVTVQDATPPTMTCLGDQMESTTMNCEFIVPDYRVNAMVSDNCSLLSVTQTPAPGTSVPLGTTLIEIIANDGSNEITCLFSLNVVDSAAPTAVCQNITVQLDTNGMATITPEDIDAGSNDNCGNISMAIANDTFTCNDIGVNTVIFTVTDDAGLTNTCSAMVTVEDTIAPIVSCQNITIVLDANNQAEITALDIDAGSSDNCSIASYDLDITNFDCSMVGDTVVTLTVTDVNGNVSACSAVVTVQDNEMPIAMCQSITVELDANGMATITPEDLDMGSSDNCANFTTAIDVTTFDCSNLGDNPVVFSITDVQGNVATCEATVTVIDVIAPVLDCQNMTITLDENYSATVEVLDIFGGSSDNCTIVSTEIDIDTFNCNNIGENEIVLTVTDQSGNVSSCTTTVLVVEGIFPPVAISQNVTVPLQQDGTGVVEAIDFNAGSTGVRCFNGFSIDRDTFGCEDIGDPIQIEFTVYNAAGETDTGIAFVNVVDGLSPIITCPADQSVVSNGLYILPDYFDIGEAIAMDNCSSSLITSQYPYPGTQMEQGTHIITVTAEDMGGFKSECEFTLYVETILGVESPQASLETLVMYPNPANQEINISNPQFIELQSITIYDISGRIVKQQTIAETNALFSMDIATLQSASYVVVIATQTGQVIKQLVKE